MKVLTQGVSLITITTVKLLQDCLQHHCVFLVNKATNGLYICVYSKLMCVLVWYTKHDITAVSEIKKNLQNTIH